MRLRDCDYAGDLLVGVAVSGMTVKEIVREWLREKGYDGLCAEDCGCSVDDLMPCSGYGASEDCMAGYSQKATEEEKEVYGENIDCIFTTEKQD